MFDLPQCLFAFASCFEKNIYFVGFWTLRQRHFINLKFQEIPVTKSQKL